MRYSEWTEMPAGFLDAGAADLTSFSPNPILLHLKGRKERPLFLSILLHGNEDTGWRALQAVLRKHKTPGLPRSLSVFIGNIPAAHAGVRRLENQPDYNRIWPGTALQDTAEAHLARAVMRRMEFLHPFAFIDIHNNTGKNPFYACVTEVNAQNLYLARLFSRTVVFFRSPVGTAAGALNSLCPSITVECGKAGSTAGDIQAANLIEAALHLDHFPEHDHTTQDVDVYHTVATLKIPATTSFSFGDEAADLVFPEHFEDWNFRELTAGTVFARASSSAAGMIVTGENGENVAAQFITRRGQALQLARGVMPAMITTNKEVIRQDCLCYFMERVALAKHTPAPPTA